MSITQEQLQQFGRNPFPDGVRLSVSETGLFIKKGNEALVTKTTSGVAFKWYAKLSGRDQTELLKYADSVNQDEAILRNLGLGTNQLPDSHFFVGSYQGLQSELYVVQPWIDGKLLKDFSLREILSNKPLCHSLANLFFIADEFNKATGRFADLKGSEKFLGISDPTKIVWPFRSTNIIVADDTAILADARSLNPQPGTIKYGASKVHQAISLFTSRNILT